MEAFYRTHAYLVEHTNAPVRRDLMDEIDWSDRLIGIKGTRGVGKTTFLLQYAKEKFGYDRSCLFVNMNNFYFSGHSIVDFANEFQKRGGKVLLPFFLEKRNFSENLLKTMNMMIEVDILLIKQIELKYLSKIKKLLYLLAVDGPVAPNVSQLARRFRHLVPR